MHYSLGVALMLFCISKCVTYSYIILCLVVTPPSTGELLHDLYVHVCVLLACSAEKPQGHMPLILQAVQENGKLSEKVTVYVL